MNRTKRTLIRYDVTIRTGDGAYGLAAVIGLDAGRPDWARGRRLGINPHTARRGWWTVTDVETGAAMYTEERLTGILAFAGNVVGAVTDEAFWAAVEHGKRMRAEVTNLVPADYTEMCVQALGIKRTEHVEVL